MEVMSSKWDSNETRVELHSMFDDKKQGFLALLLENKPKIQNFIQGTSGTESLIWPNLGVFLKK